MKKIKKKKIKINKNKWKKIQTETVSPNAKSTTYMNISVELVAEVARAPSASVVSLRWHPTFPRIYCIPHPQASCGSGSISENHTYFTSSSITKGANCNFKICKSNSNVCSLRLDFETFDLNIVRLRQNSDIDSCFWFLIAALHQCCCWCCKWKTHSWGWFHIG